MDLGPIEATRAVDKALAAWAAAIDARESAAAPVDADAAPGVSTRTVPAAGATPFSGAGFVERVLGDANPAVPVSEPALPGMDNDPGHESATVQTLSRPLTSGSEAPRGGDAALPAAQHAKSEFALPASLLVPSVLVGLQVEPATGWPMQRRSEPERPRSGRDSHNERERDAPADEREHRSSGDDGTSRPPPAREEAGPRRADELVFEDDDGGEWCETLSRGLREALAARVVPQALLAAAEQWRRGRCVVLACPQGADPAGPGWAFVLWPRPDDGRAPSHPLALFGLRVAARLQWQTLPPTTPWCHVRVVKEHHPRRGRQLVSPDDEPTAAANAALACEVQLGPVLARSLRWCEVRVHIQAAQRFWAALGRQWSVHVVVSARPLVAARAATKEASPC